MTLDLANVMDRATEGMPVDTRRLVDAGVARGAALTRARRRRTAIGSVAAVTVALLIGWGGPAVVDQAVDEGARSGQPTSNGPVAGPNGLALPDAQELAGRLGGLLLGTARDVTVPEVPYGLAFQLQLTRPGGSNGVVRVDLGVDEAIPRRDRAQRLDDCVAVQKKVSPKDGTDCVVLEGGYVDLWHDDVPPADDTALGGKAMMAQATYHGFDGRVVQVTAWNTPTPTTDPAPGTPPVLRTQELLEIVQDPGWFDPA